MAEAEYIFTSAEAAAWTGGRLLGDAAVSVFSAEVDSRKCTEGCIFFALEGERVDGHDYVEAAFNAGACGAVVSAGWAGLDEAAAMLVEEGRFLLAVDSPLKALQHAASAYMKNITGPVRVGITGSSGKTTTKELVAAVLDEKYSVVKTAGNYNSEIGLPLTVFNIRNSHDYAVIEMGINRVGEMDVLSEILRPDLVVITNIGTAHIGIFKNIETTAFEKRRSVSFFDESGWLFVDEDEQFRDFLADGHPGTYCQLRFSQPVIGCCRSEVYEPWASRMENKF